MIFPPISCVCCTYGRPKNLIDECVFSFLSQDYAGEKELIIVNDCNRQMYIYDHPEIKIFNINERFDSLGDKRNFSIEKSSHDILAIWDDDDIFLPHRLSFSYINMKDRSFFKPSKAFVMHDGKISGVHSNLFHSGSLFRKSIFNKVGKYGKLNCGEDYDFEVRIEKELGYYKNFDDITPQEIFYIYRYAGSGSYHMSNFRKEDPDALNKIKLEVVIRRYSFR